MSVALWLLMLTQLPVDLPAGSVAVEVESGWALFNGEGSFLSVVTDVDGIKAVSLRPLPKGGGIVFTGPREGKNNGLFLKRGKAPVQDISISSGYHAWPAASPSEKFIIVAHNPGADSGPMGMHGATANAQLWQLPLTRTGTGKPRQLTDSVGCKSSPSFKDDATVAFTHSNCRGTHGLEWLSLPVNKVTVVEANHLRRDTNAILSPNAKRVAFSRGHYRTWQVVTADWPTLAGEAVIFTVHREGEAPSLAWLVDNKTVLVSRAADVVAARHGDSSSVIWQKEEAP